MRRKEDIMSNLKNLEGVAKMKKIALVVGHGYDKRGAYNKTWAISEWDYNWTLTKEIAKRLESKYYVRRYCSTESRVSISDIEFCDLTIGFHCNAFDGRASGCEMLTIEDKHDGQLGLLTQEIAKVLDIPDRGVKKILPGDRGYFFLSNIQSGGIITETFFIDNDYDLGKGIAYLKKLADIYALTIESMIDEG
jgi:N-acetylmuramoyl-L-alanine amidase